MNKNLLIVLAASLILVGCASNNRHVPRHHSYTTIEYGTVVASEDVTVGGTRSGIGAYIGSAAALHDSTSHRFLGLVLRGLAGAYAGAVIEEAVTRRPGKLYTIELNSGEMIEVLSRNDELMNGDCASVRFSGRRHTTVQSTSDRRCKISTTHLST